LSITVWYPAQQPTDAAGPGAAVDAAPDASGAPYPLILSSTKVAGFFAPHLVSHGFVWASVNGLDTYEKMGAHMFAQPLDILAALNFVGADSLEGLNGMIDADHAGAIGYSFDGYNTLALSGARIDPQHYLAQCPNPDPTTQEILSLYTSFDCEPASNWADFVTQAPESVTGSEDGMWQPMTDPRIRAVMPLAGEGWWLFGERGLAAVDRPVLIIVATRDPLYEENVLIFRHMGTPDKSLISFVGPEHLMIYNTDMQARMAHFAAAFFGYHLQRREDLKEYFSENGMGQSVIWRGGRTRSRDLLLRGCPEPWTTIAPPERPQNVPPYTPAIAACSP
jgi:predicted dienelactone hydrolase